MIKTKDFLYISLCFYTVFYDKQATILKTKKALWITLNENDAMQSFKSYYKLFRKTNKLFIFKKIYNTIAN